MSLKQQLKKMGATPGKLALIAVLVLVLFGVIVKQLPSSAPEKVNTAPAIAQSLDSKQSGTTNVNAEKSNVESELPAWPVINLTETLANDPFVLPRWAVQEVPPEVIAVNDEPGELAELQEQGASIVVISKEKKSATIGEQKLQVGDILEGYRITDITTQGIFLHKLKINHSN